MDSLHTGTETGEKGQTDYCNGIPREFWLPIRAAKKYGTRLDICESPSTKMAALPFLERENSETWSLTMGRRFRVWI
eukprot:c40463_g1_i1 orf=225-455(+)